jgi:uncharacterized membrane protein
VLRSSHAALATALLALAACSSSTEQGKADASPAPSATCPAPDNPPTFADLEQGILTICRQCHSASVTGADRHDAPPGIDFDTYEQFANAGEAAAYFVRYQIMPPQDVEGPTEEQRQELYDWVACGKPR